MARREEKNNTSANKASGSFKTVGCGQSETQNNSASIKTLYKTNNAKKQTSEKSGAKGRNAGDYSYSSATGKYERGSIAEKSPGFSDEAEEKHRGEYPYSLEVNQSREKETVNSLKSFYKKDWEEKSEENEDNFKSYFYKEEEKEDKVNAGKFLFGLVDQAADKFVGGAVGAADVFFGAPLQNAMDYAEEKFDIPDMGENFISSYNRQLQEITKKKAEDYAKNADKYKATELVNEYGSEILSFFPNLALAWFSGGMSAGASGMSSLGKTASVASNPAIWSEFAQTTGRSYNQALDEGADKNQAQNYALINGMLDLGLNSIGLAEGKIGMETLPGQLQSITDPMHYAGAYGEAAIHDGFESVAQGVAHRASRAIYDEDVELFSEDNPNAILNPNSAAMDFAMGGAGAVAMGGMHAAAKSAETVASNQVSRMQSLRYMDELVKANEGLDADYALQQAKILQKLTNGIVLEPEELRLLDMTSEAIQKFYTEKTGIAFSSMDNVRPDILRQKYQAGAIKAKNGDIKVESTPHNILEKWFDERYNKGAKAIEIENSEFKHGDWTKNVVLEDGTHFGRDGRKKVLKPDTAYISGENHYIYQTDSLARPSNATGVLLMGQDGASKYRYKNPPEKIKGYDDSGHIVGRRFGAGGKLDNILSQCSKINQGDYKKMEDVWAAALESGKEVYVDFDIHYPGESRRPDWYDVTYYIDGEYTSQRIFNPDKK